MAGNHRSGRPGLSVVTHELNGTARKDRHAHRVDPASGGPECPAGFTKDEQWCWDFVVSELIALKIAKRIDTPALMQMCEMWGLYRTQLEAAKSDPADDSARCAVVQYRAAYDSIASRFGLTASDRMRLQTPAEKKTGVTARKRA